DLMVVSPGFRRDHPAITDFGGKPILSEVEFAYRISDAPMIGITGTNGKSTTTVLTWLFVNAMGKTGHLCGNIAGSGYPERPLS
ncbi:UDP-N-acetylmuramoyl-L-alanine--D-glutamate ligase, partial [Acinetobacter baumannii]